MHRGGANVGLSCFGSSYEGWKRGNIEAISTLFPVLDLPMRDGNLQHLNKLFAKGKFWIFL